MAEEEHPNLKKHVAEQIEKGKEEEKERKKMFKPLDEARELDERLERIESKLSSIKGKRYKIKSHPFNLKRTFTKRTIGHSLIRSAISPLPKLKRTGKFGLRKRDQIRVLRLKNMLERKRYDNEIQKMKLKIQIESLRKKGNLPMILPSVPQIVLPIEHYVFPNSPEIYGDVQSVFSADVNPAENDTFGNEDYFGGENYYAEDFWGNEFDDGDVLAHLAIKPRRGVSPLLW